MHRSKRLVSVLSSRMKAAVEQMADVESGLSQSALIRGLTRNEAQERGVWPPDQQKGTDRRLQEVQHG